MAVINDLIERISDPELRRRISEEVARMQKQKKFGLVFEEHLPEATPLYDIPIKKKSLVSLKDRYFKDFYLVKDINGDKLICEKQDDSREIVELNRKDVVAVAQFGQPIYPYLKPMDAVKNAPDSDLWHTLIEADNYHALQLLVYLYGGMVDCIYIDPPYNTGAKDWKYNNDYVDSSDAYRHSKWLSMMKKRLLLAKKLLNPKDSVLIVTIDEKEYLRLGCLLEELFPEARIQMVSTVIKAGGSKRYGEFTRSGEYIFFVMFGCSEPDNVSYDMSKGYNIQHKEDKTPITWQGLRRRGGENWPRHRRPNLFYPLFIDEVTHKLVGLGESPSLETDRHSIIAPDGTFAVWPLAPNGEEGTWQISQERFMKQLEQGTLIVNSVDKEKEFASVLYLKTGDISRIESGQLKIIGRNEKGQVIVEPVIEELNTLKPGTIWNMPYHDASTYGTLLVRKILPGNSFAYPKSLYAVRDTLDLFTRKKKDSLIIDFFAGSGTTLHAVNLLNAEDGGKRRCIMVTNNEVSGAEAKALRKKGYQPGDEEWEKYGIARYVNWPRTVCSIEGHDINGNPLKGNYLSNDQPMQDGFKANAKYFKLGFLDKYSIEAYRQFHELLPLLWMKAGAIGECPSLEGKGIPSFMILDENKMAILTEESNYAIFLDQTKDRKDIKTIFLVVDSEIGFREMAAPFKWAKTYQLYKDYLENFSINYDK
jgi:adenine-specific DNA-methyltransferase